MTSIVNFGKYSGYTFQQLLERDIQYCKFIHSCPENGKTKEFKDFLVANLDKFIQQKDQEALKKKLSELSS